METGLYYIVWNYLLFEGTLFMSGYYGKQGFYKVQKHLLILIGFWSNFVIIFTGIRFIAPLLNSFYIGSDKLLLSRTIHENA